MASPLIIKEYLDQDKNLTLLKGKKPSLNDWTEKKVSEKRLYSYNGNIGWVLGENDLVVDIDPKNGGNESFNKLRSYVSSNDDFSFAPTVKTPSGGIHIYLTLGEHDYDSFKKTLNKEYPGIDFLTKGSQCVIPSSVTEQGVYEWYDVDLGGFEQNEAPESLLRLIGNRSFKSLNPELGDFSGMIGNSSNWSEEKVLDMLSKLDPGMPNDEWVKVGMALHDWDPIEGLELWETWSQGGDNYTPGDTEVRWRSFDLNGGVTLGTISYMVKETVYDKESDLVRDFIKRINLADEKTIEFEIAPAIRKHELSNINKEKLVGAIKSRFKTILGITLPIANIRGLVNTSIHEGRLVQDDKIPDWCRDWIYVNTHSSFMNLESMQLHKAESFNVGMGQFVPESEGGSKPSAFKYVSDRGFIKKVDTTAYLPTYEGLICKIDNTTYLNSFNPKSVPIEADEFSEEGLKTIEKIKKHIKFICTSERDSEILTHYLAHQIQFPGRQILWAPIIQSIEGIGKSFFGELLRCCLGDRNVGSVAPKQVMSDFNAWAVNVSVNVLEELRVKGQNRYEVTNSLKPLITDRIIQINDKGVRPYTTYNTTNYLCFTNYKDCIPLTETDRRWWVIFVPIESLDQLEKHVGAKVEDYFPDLFDSLRANAQEVRKWLLEYKLQDWFLKLKQAPMTEHKKAMIATEEANHEGLAEVREMIMEGGKYWNTSCVSSAPLFEAFFMEYPDIEINTTRRNNIMKQLGYTMHPNKIKIDGTSHRVWTKMLMTNDEIRESFESVDDDVDSL